tara:strand:+ start:4937 stop:5554 length:618 start_codon:yes stop_codon:yes gene_type:complete
MASTASTSDIDIASRALVLIGAEPISSFSGTTTESQVATNLYEDIVRSSLTQTRWRFASNIAQLSRLTDVPVDESKYASAYQIPTESLIIHGIAVNGQQIDYDIFTKKIFCNANTNDIVIGEYTYRPDTTEFPPYYILGLQFHLASVFSGAIAEDENKSLLFEQKAQQQYMIARNIDSQQTTTERLNLNRFSTFRGNTRTLSRKF